MNFKNIKKIVFLLLIMFSLSSLTSCNDENIKSNIKDVIDNLESEEPVKTPAVTPEKTPVKTPSVDVPTPTPDVPTPTPTPTPGEPTQTPDVPTHCETILSVIEGEIGHHTVEGVVVAYNSQSFLLSDSTATILVYKGSTWSPDVLVGYKLRVTGVTSDYAKARQFGKDATYEVLSTETTVNEPKVTSIGGYAADNFAKASAITPMYVKVYGVLNISGSYYNLTIDDDLSVIGSLSYPINKDELSGLNGKYIQVYGYVTGLSGGNKYLNIMPTSVTEVTEISILEANNIATSKQNDEFTFESYMISGTITEIKNDTYGNMIVNDGNDSIYVYGVYNSDGFKFSELLSKPSVGDTVVLVGVLGKYNSMIEMKNAVLYNFDKNSVDEEAEFVNFFMINDTHGAFLDSTDAVSIGRVDTLVDKLTAANGEYIKIHNGDAFQGSYICGQKFGLPLIESLNVMDFDCFVIGNHEFDWGIDKIAQYADGDLTNGEAEFPFLGANIYYKGTKNRPEWIDAYTIVEYGDIKVGIIGVMGPDQESSILTSYVKDYEFVDPYNVINETAKTLRGTLGCSVVVVATHDYDEALNSKIASLSGNSRIDAIFSAHTHQKINETVTRADGISIPVVQNYHKNNMATSVTVKLENNTMTSATVKQYYPEDYSISSEIQEIIVKYQDLITESNASLGSTRYSISKSTLGEYAVDAMLNYEYGESKFAGIDIAIVNTGGVRATISSGDITRADVFEVFPFNNRVVLVNMSGALLKSLCAKNNNYFYIGVSDEFGTYANFEDSKVYQLAVIDYVFEGTRYTQFSNLTTNNYLQTEIIMRDLLIDYIDNKY